MRIEPAATRRRHAPSLTPLIDVVFILLVFFMLVSSFVRWNAVRVQTSPAASHRAQPAVQHALRVSVFPDGRLLLDGEPVSLDDLVRRVGALRSPQVRVVPMPALRLQRLTTVLDRLSRAGARASLTEP